MTCISVEKEKLKQAAIVETVVDLHASPEEKLQALKNYIRSLGSLAVGYSSGVDSTFLLKVAHEVLGNHALAITAKSHSFPKRELTDAIAFCKQQGIRQLVIETNELDIQGFRENPANRCYICKKALFSSFLAAAAEEGIAYVAEGSNLDDNGDYRPGLIAVAELQVKSPLRSCCLTKAEIRYLSRKMGLPTWEKQSFACLASRFPYGEEITAEKLFMIEQAENLLQSYGFHQYRVRIHGTIARIEILPEQFDLLLREDIRTNVYREFKRFGFSYIAMDLAGFRSGSMNEILTVR